jgi:hypothetical protein
MMMREDTGDKSFHVTITITLPVTTNGFVVRRDSLVCICENRLEGTQGPAKNYILNL